MSGKDFGVKTDVLFRSEGVGEAADCIEFLGNIQCGSAFGALEEHMFNKMCNAPLGGSLVSGARIDPDAGRNRMGRRDLFRNHTNSVTENRFLVQFTPLLQRPPILGSG